MGVSDGVMTKFGQELRQRQELRMGPLQLQVVRLLAIPALELSARIKEELERNPLLEEGKEPDSESDSLPEGAGDQETEAPEPSVEEEFSVEDYLSEDDGWEARAYTGGDAQEAREERGVAMAPTFREDLVEQLGFRRIPAQVRALAEYIVWNLGDDGYLRMELDALRDQMYLLEGEDVPVAQWDRALALVQDLEPRGVGARSLQECLLLQIGGAENPVESLARCVLTETYEAFTKRNYPQIQAVLGVGEGDLRVALHFIATLSPRPRLGSGGGDLPEIIEPDFVLRPGPGGEGWTIQLSGENEPDLHVSTRYRPILEQYAARRHKGQTPTDQERETVDFVRRNMDRARGFIEALRMRNHTLRAVVEAIVALQPAYFVEGDVAQLRPMLMREVAARTGLDISTVSRVARSKYLQTPWGIIRLRDLFAQEISQREGEAITSRDAKRVLSEIIDTEDKRQPLADEQLMAELNARGFRFTRRTIAKYRQALGIPPSRLRRVL